MALGAGGERAARRTRRELLSIAVASYESSGPPRDDQHVASTRRGGGNADESRQLLCQLEARASAASRSRGENEPYVVAVCGGRIHDADLDKGIPDIVNILFGLDDVQWGVPIDGGLPTQRVPRRETLQKRSTGSEIQSGLFQIADDGEHTYRLVSGVFFSPRRVWDPRPKEVGWACGRSTNGPWSSCLLGVKASIPARVLQQTSVL
jgi:hypothetical protein